ncbi:MAG TPA: LLM class flavin-dependent oxidoreductase [Acidimicrobiales bacterium]|nr:LLM class flavin-dependent oxidoreductase [Acidimicrobiales bacterium]
MTTEEKTGSITWGAFVPHGGANEFAGWEPGKAWQRMADAAAAFDELGYDHLWLSDHLMASGGDRSGLYFEAYTAMAGLSQVTKRARLGALVTCAAYRSAAMLAKQAANVDVMSNGRLIFALGGGWDEPEFDAFGLPFPSARDRVELFTETLESIKRLWSEDQVDYDGNQVKLTGARCEPRPATMPPIWTGTHGPKGLRVAARLADVANWNVGLADFKRLTGVLNEACEKEGRDPATIDTSVFRLADLTGGDATRRVLANMGAPPEAYDAVKPDHFIGTPDEVAEKVSAFVDAGASHIISMFLDSPESDDSARIFMEEVAPRFAAN